MQNPFDPGYYCSDELREMGFARVGQNVRIAKNCKIVGLGNIAFGDDCRVDDFSTLIATGPLTFGNRVHIHSYCQIGARGGVMFEDFSSIASRCLVYSASDCPMGRHMIGGAVDPGFTKPKIAPVVFRKHSGAFANCTILPGVTFEEGAVACAHSLVSHSVPAWTLVSGSPAVHRTNRSRRLLALLALSESQPLAA